MTDLTVSQMASLGGKARAKKLSSERKKEIASLAGSATLRKYGPDYYKRIRNGEKPSKIASE